MKAVFPVPVRDCRVAVSAGETLLFDGKGLDAWECAPGAWEIEEDGSLVCRMETSEGDDGTVKTRSMGYLWTKTEYGDFELSLSYKLSEGANSGVSTGGEGGSGAPGLRDPVDGRRGLPEGARALDAKKRNGSFYEGKAPEVDAANPVGEWNTLTLKCEGTRMICHLNGKRVFDVDVNDWPEAGRNPDGTSNKFKVAIKDKPRSGRIGLQNHGQVVWFKDIRVRSLN